MTSGVCQWVFNSLLTAGEMDTIDCIQFVGNETDADCFEPLSRYWSDDLSIEDQAEEARTVLDDHDLCVSCYTLESDFAAYDEDVFEETVADCILALDIAEILGTDTMRLDPKSTLPEEQQENPDIGFVIERVSHGMQQVTDVAADRGVTVGVENHGMLLGRTAQVAKMLDLVDRPNFGVNLDPTNFRSVHGEDHIAATRQFAESVVHCHIKDFEIRTEKPINAEETNWRRTRADEWVRSTVGGEGDMQWPLIFSILRDAGYDGTISLEISLPTDIFGSVRDGVMNLNRIITEVEGG